MAIPQNQLPHNAAEMLLNMAKALGLEIEIKGTQEPTEPQQVKKHAGRKLPKVLSPQQVEKLFRPINTDCPTGLRNRTIFQVMLKAGLRVSEACDLQLANIDFDENMIHVINGKGGVDRNVPMGPCLIDWLQRWDEIRPQAEYFFCAIKGTRLSPRYLNQVLERLSEKSGVCLQDGLKQIPISCHKLRHTCATSWLKDGLSLPDIQRLLGHKNINTTMIYLDVSMDDLKKKITALG